MRDLGKTKQDARVADDCLWPEGSGRPVQQIVVFSTHLHVDLYGPFSGITHLLWYLGERRRIQCY